MKRLVSTITVVISLVLLVGMAFAGSNGLVVKNTSDNWDSLLINLPEIMNGKIIVELEFSVEDNSQPFAIHILSSESNGVWAARTEKYKDKLFNYGKWYGKDAPEGEDPPSVIFPEPENNVVNKITYELDTDSQTATAWQGKLADKPSDNVMFEFRPGNSSIDQMQLVIPKGHSITIHDLKVTNDGTTVFEDSFSSGSVDESVYFAMPGAIDLQIVSFGEPASEPEPSPETGDEISLYIAVALIVLSCMAVVLIIKRRAGRTEGA